jgi:SAM-dependent methyltransferase
MKTHYDSKYYEYQKDAGVFGGFMNQIFFQEYINPNDKVLDFGCRGGFLLKNLDCKKRIGIEINPAAAEVARENGIEIYLSVDDVLDSYVDTIISCHALEHTFYPLKEMQGLYNKLKKGGKAIIVVPCESIRWKFKKNDVDQYLYTWSPMSIGNIIALAGFNIIESKPYYYGWFLGHWNSVRSIIVKLFGWKGYHFCCKLRGYLGPLYQVRVIATK